MGARCRHSQAAAQSQSTTSSGACGQQTRYCRSQSQLLPAPPHLTRLSQPSWSTPTQQVARLLSAISTHCPLPSRSRLLRPSLSLTTPGPVA